MFCESHDDDDEAGKQRASAEDAAAEMRLLNVSSARRRFKSSAPFLAPASTDANLLLLQSQTTWLGSIDSQLLPLWSLFTERKPFSHCHTEDRVFCC